ncbi:MAG: hypothetical protein WA211_21340 [Candidatus Acidiferrales bacterium]
MKAAASLFAAILFTSGAAMGQQQAANVPMQCRDMAASGNFIFANEIVVNGLACHAVTQPDSGSADQALSAGHVPPDGSAAALQPASRSEENAVPSVYIEPMEGFDGILSVALERKHVPLAAEINEARATYVLQVKWPDADGNVVKASYKRTHRSDEVPTLQLVERRTGTIVFAYKLSRSNTWHGEQGTAETVASLLKEQLAKR